MCGCRGRLLPAPTFYRGDGARFVGELPFHFVTPMWRVPSRRSLAGRTPSSLSTPTTTLYLPISSIFDATITFSELPGGEFQLRFSGARRRVLLGGRTWPRRTTTTQEPRDFR